MTSFTQPTITNNPDMQQFSQVYHLNDLKARFPLPEMIHMTLKIAIIFEGVLPVLPIQFGQFFIRILEDCVQIGPI
jgi:hypothetical protein